MYISIFLITISILGIINLLITPEFFGFYQGNQILHYWYGSIITFAIPIILAILGLTKNRLIRIGQLVWGIWLSLLSLGVIATSSTHNSNISSYGYIFISIILILSIAVVLFATIDLTAKKSKKMESNS